MPPSWTSTAFLIRGFRRSGHQRHPVLWRLPHRLGLSGSGQPGGDLRLRRRLSQRHLRQPGQTRHEAAALLNACPDRITEVTDELRRLLKEFETELAILKGRVDGLEARVGELKQPTTTKLRGQADFYWCSEGRSWWVQRERLILRKWWIQARIHTLNLDTSFTGKRLWAPVCGRATWSVWTESDSYLSDAKSGDNTLKVDKLWYSFPIGDEFKVTVGALIENYMIETPTRYSFILKAFKLGGYGAVLGASTGQGFGVQWRQDVDPGDAAFNIAVNYVADGGDGAKSGSKKQMFGEDTDAYLLSQIGYGNRKWYVSALYALKNARQPDGFSTAKAAMGYSTPTAKNLAHPLNAVGLRGYWSPEDSGFFPPSALVWTSAGPIVSGTAMLKQLRAGLLAWTGLMPSWKATNWV